jgi:hypothetical protein
MQEQAAHDTGLKPTKDEAMNAKKKLNTASEVPAAKPPQPAKHSADGQLSDEALNTVTGGATIPVKRKKKKVIWA